MSTHRWVYTHHRLRTPIIKATGRKKTVKVSIITYRYTSVQRHSLKHPFIEARKHTHTLNMAAQTHSCSDAGE